MPVDGDAIRTIGSRPGNQLADISALNGSASGSPLPAVRLHPRPRDCVMLAGRGLSNKGSLASSAAPHAPSTVITTEARRLTTVRNPGGSTQAAARYDAMLSRGEWVGPDARHAGSIIEPPPLGGESFAYPKTPAEWDEEATRQASAGMTYFKLYHDLTPDELAQGVKVAKAHGLIPIAHLESVSWTRAAQLGVEQIEHTFPISVDLLEPAARAQLTSDPFRMMFRWFELADFDGPLIRNMIATLREKRTIVTLTLIASEVSYNVKDETSIFPIADRICYQPESFASAMANYASIAKIWTDDDAKRARAAMPKVLQLAKLLHDSGVRLMIGTNGTVERQCTRESLAIM